MLSILNDRVASIDLRNSHATKSQIIGITKTLTDFGMKEFFFFSCGMRELTTIELADKIYSWLEIYVDLLRSNGHGVNDDSGDSETKNVNEV